MGKEREMANDGARELGVSRITLYRLMGRHGLRIHDSDAPNTVSVA